jgi:HK97 family phage prohead protease
MADRPYETRTVVAQVEYRDDEQGPTIVGHAATFNQPYQVGFFTETIHPDAFKRTLAGNPDVRLLVAHEGQPLARTKSGTLELGTDEHGLTVRATLDPSDPDVQRLIPKMRRGDMDQMSFAFRVPAGGDAWDHNANPPTRSIREANLSGGDVSIVTYPANENASVSLRSEDTRDAHATLLHALIEEKRSGRPVNEAALRDAWTALMAEPLPEPRAEAPADPEDPPAEDEPQENSAGIDFEVARYLADQARTQRA